MRATRGTLLSTTSSNACAAFTVSPSIKMRAWGIVPTGSVPMRSALATVATPSQPPRYAARSIIGAIAGCMRRAPNEITFLPGPAASRQRAARVAIPVAWQSSPSTAVSSTQKARYEPSTSSTGSSGRNTSPSAIARTFRSRPLRNSATSSIPARTAQLHRSGRLFATNSARTRRSIPFARSTSSVRAK